MYIYEKLTRNALFRSLDAATVRQLLEAISYHRKHFRKHEVIAREGDTVTGLLFLLRGSLHAEMISASGKVLKIEDIRRDHSPAPAFLFGPDNHYPVHIVADCDSEGVFFKKQALLRLIIMNETVLKNFLDMISAQAQFLSGRIRFLVMQGIKGKIAQYLLIRADRVRRDDIQVVCSHTELSELFGVTRPSLTRALREMHLEGVLSVEGRNITIRNKSALREYLG